MQQAICDVEVNCRYKCKQQIQKVWKYHPEDKAMQELYSVLHSGIYQPLQTQFYSPWHTQWGMSYTCKG